MMRNLPVIVVVLVASPVFARAEVLVVAKPGIMCRSLDALARLTLPGGDSRTHRDPPRAEDLARAGSGGCRDLVPGQRLTILQSFRNTARVTLDGPSGEVFTAPTIDLGPAPGTPVAAAGSDNQEAQGNDPISETALNALIGQTKESFVGAHPGGRCVRTGPDDETCTYDAGSYSGGSQSSCPLQFACTVTMYGFHDGRLASYQSGLQFEYEWKRAYQLALEHYDVPVTQQTATGASAFFRTRNGVLGFGHTFGGSGQPPTWAIRYYLTGEGAASPQ